MATSMTAKLISSAMEDYLKAIFELGESNIKTQDVAATLGVSAASVTGMLKKLAGLNLVHYERYRGVSLTPAGRLMALETIRHHRLIETYLADALGYAWHEVHAEADKLEHHISESFEARISEALGHPNFDPHGDPIPRRDGSLPACEGRPLAELKAGYKATITRITDQRSDVLRYFSEHNLIPGATVTIVDRAPFNGPLTLEQRGRRIAIAFELAQGIQARPAPLP